MEGDKLWDPPEEWIRRARITDYISWLGKEGTDYSTLWKWSVDYLEEFWESVLKYFNVSYEGNYEYVLSSRHMPGAVWFPGMKLNYAEHFFLKKREGTAVVYVNELGERKEISWEELRKKVFSVASSLLRIGVRRGDRVAGYLSNVPEALITMLASTLIGAVWSCCSSDFGKQSIMDRFSQIDPKVLVYSTGYTYNGKKIDCLDNAASVANALSIQNLYYVGSEGKGENYESLYDSKESVPVQRFDFNSPLWILFSSGTTGLPKPIVQSHGGILLEHLKVLSLHNDITEKEVFFWYTSTGWMMWNYLVSGLIHGSRIVLYDGSASYPDDYSLWELCEKEGITFFGTSAPYIHNCMRKELQPGKHYNLSRLRGIGSTGSPLTPEGFEWAYREVKQELWLASISGGTDLCTAFVGSCPILPVYSGEIQCRCLGANVQAYDEQGKAVINEVGELVITEPMPSMPVYFWNDKDGRRYFESYFSTYPGVWRHGDWIKIKERGTCIIYGRSDATIKRMGVRIGTAEIYRAVESISEVVDSVAVDIPDELGNPRLILFVVLRKEIDQEIKRKIRNKIKESVSPRYIPDAIIQVPDIPRTLNGKKVEIPLKKILMGIDKNKALNVGSISNPEVLDFYVRLAKEGKFKAEFS